MRMIFPAMSFGIFAVLLLSLIAANAETTNDLSDAEMQGRALVQKILEQKPTQDITNTGTLEIRDKGGQRTKLFVSCETVMTSNGWFNQYQAEAGTNGSQSQVLVVTHSDNEANQYSLSSGDGSRPAKIGIGVDDDRTMIPFAHSDFWLCDLGLEFFHWPEQKVLKKEFHRQCACTVLESTNPNPSTNAYSRVVCWIDEDSLGIVEAYAYDAKGQRLKNFYPKNFQKVNGQYQLESMVMENLQTDSKSTLEFDLDK